MNKVTTYLLLAACITILVLSCSNKNSDEACKHDATMNLDRGNFDAVIASGCADAMQRGAAYFGKAGFDITSVINTLSETKNNNTGSNGSPSNFSIYMTALLGKVDETTLTYLDKSKSEYDSVATDLSGIYSVSVVKDAQFYVSFVDVIKGLSLLKSVLDVFGNGTLINTCDVNSNAKLDSLDTTGCALLVGAGRPVSQCTPTGSMAVANDSPNITLVNTDSGKTYPGTYRGLIIETSGTGTNISTCPPQNQYKYLLASANSVITTASGPAKCKDGSGASWPCPILDENNNTIDLVTAFQDSIDGSISSMNAALSSGTTATSNDVLQSLTNIKTTACPNACPPPNESKFCCTSADIASYLQK